MTLSYVSLARLQPYVDLCGTEDDALALHGEAMLLGSTLLSTLASIEIALRNRIHSQLGTDFATLNWLTTAPTPLPLRDSELKHIVDAQRQARRDRYSKLTNLEKRQLDRLAFPCGIPPNIKHQKLSTKRQQQITLSEGEIVAHTTLFFWKRFFAPDYEPTLWKRSIKKLFPNKTLSRSAVSEHIETLYLARNRLAHHEPMYGPRLEKALRSVAFVRENLDSRFPDANGPLALFTQVQFENLIEKKAVFDDAWHRLVKPF